MQYYIKDEIMETNTASTIYVLDLVLQKIGDSLPQVRPQ